MARSTLRFANGRLAEERNWSTKSCSYEIHPIRSNFERCLRQGRNLTKGDAMSTDYPIAHELFAELWSSLGGDKV
jgi:hypothetical protein